MRRAAIVLVGAAALIGCMNDDLPPGLGWSRAPDLSVYSAMALYGDMAREHSMLCGGFEPASVARHWDEDFAAREQAVTAGLVARHGAEAVEDAQRAAVATRRVSCPDVPTLEWRDHYSRLLRLLETRLGRT